MTVPTTTTSTNPPSTPPDWLKGYAPAPGPYDQLKAPDGSIRPAWARLAAALQTISAGDLAARAENLRRLIQENGITYNVYGETGNTARPWGMDLLPMVLEWEEWRKMDEALRQRAHLFNLILQDLYGPQTLLEERILPPELVLGNPAFLRPCHGFVPPDGVFVQIYGADLGRSPDGRWWVLADRLDAPSGIGYALENRALTTRVLSDWLRDHKVARLEGFFQKMRTMLENLAARRGENPRLVLLTPGPANETYFEQSYLARNQGLPLVEGGDLAVRSDRVYLKTLTGMQPVDLILRRVDADFCDPLELRNESLLGVPGLVQAARTGQVVLVNSLGAGLLESPSLSPFFPALCRHLLHEELKLPAVAGWWCGQRRELNFVLENLETLILQPAHSLDPRARVFGPRLDAAEREQWRERLRAEPAAWCARERLALATTPVLAAGRLAPHPFQLRAFLVSSGGECHLMPGGLTRIPADANDLSVSMQQGGSSKDTWVLPPAESPVPADLTPAATAAVSPRLRRQTVDMPSRVADNLFWLGRYLERAESQARVLRLLVAVLTEEGAAAAPAAVLPFFHHLAFNATPRLLASTTPPALDLAAAERHLRSLLWEEVSEHSLLANTNRLETAAYRVKERLSSDAWQLLGRLRRLRRAPAAAPVFDGGAYGDLNDVIAVLAAVSGLIMENMTRGHGWIFLDLGRRLERGLQLAHLLHQALVPFSPPADLLQNLLVCGDSQLTYRRRYLTHLQPVLVLDLLACDESNPRSLAFQLRAVREHVAELPRSAGDDLPRAPERLALSLYCQIRLAEIGPLSQEDATGARPTLGTFLGSLARDLAALSLAVEQLYFSHGESPADD